LESLVVARARVRDQGRPDEWYSAYGSLMSAPRATERYRIVLSRALHQCARAPLSYFRCPSAAIGGGVGAIRGLGFVDR